jgi:hypothetical protein
MESWFTHLKNRISSVKNQKTSRYNGKFFRFEKVKKCPNSNENLPPRILISVRFY